MATFTKGFKQGDRVRVADHYSSDTSLRRNEVGVIIQKIRDCLLWRTKRLDKYVYMVKGPTGKTTVFRQEDIELIIEGPVLNKTNVVISLPPLVQPGHYIDVESREETKSEHFRDETKTAEKCQQNPQSVEAFGKYIQRKNLATRK